MKKTKAVSGFLTGTVTKMVGKNAEKGVKLDEN